MPIKTELVLTGPEGANPLGFLCALGVLRTLDNAWPAAGVRMAWRQNGAHWQPVLSAFTDLGDNDVIVNALYTHLKINSAHPSKQWDDTCNIPSDIYRAYALDCVKRLDQTGNRDESDWVAAIACELVHDDKGYVDDTAFRTMSGQGHQHFLKQMRLLTDVLEPKHVHEALFEWHYQDEKLNLRFDPAEDRRHALRWKSPDKDPVKTVWGANCLAVQALPLYPVFPVSRYLETTGFTGQHRDDTFWTWPIWSGFLSVDAVRSTLAMDELQKEKLEKRRLFVLGIQEVYRSQRIMAGKYRAFSAAYPV
ncbi:MAG: hypothetical protein M1140_11640 [Chloroflexi bacterium]|nr:hypothetical protein [Chloroflexota bacterium]